MGLPGPNRSVSLTVELTLSHSMRHTLCVTHYVADR